MTDNHFPSDNHLPSDNSGASDDPTAPDRVVAPDRDSLDDKVILGLVGTMLNRLEPISPRAKELAYQARQMTTLNEELATLVYDSSTAGDQVLVRGDEGRTRLMSFTNDHISIELNLPADGRTLIGEISPVETDELLIETEGGETMTVLVDEFGRFRAEAAAGPIRLRVVSKLVTPWIIR